MPDRNINQYLIVDWRKGKTRTRKSKPSDSELGTNELIAELKINVSIPEVEVPTLAAEIEVPEPMVHSATLEALSDEEMPDWTDTADRLIADRDLGAELNGATPTERCEVMDSITLNVLREAPGRPNIDNVTEYVHEKVAAITTEN